MFQLFCQFDVLQLYIYKLYYLSTKEVIGHSLILTVQEIPIDLPLPVK